MKAKTALLLWLDLEVREKLNEIAKKQDTPMTKLLTRLIEEEHKKIK